LVDAGMLARLKRGARIINIARGEIVEEAAMIEALRSGKLRGAYLDVFQDEPLPPDSLLWDMPNVIVTPHNSPAASGHDQRVYDLFAANLDRWRSGEALVNEIRK
jgi:phosphoglycerate dehydrogenase-like enzyme